jgi:molecular chaperone DnaK (HSP70)
MTHRTLDLSLPPDIAIAQGGALYAAHKAGVGSFPVESVQTVNSHPLGLLVRKMSEQRNVNDVVLPRGKPTRTEVTRTYRFQPGMKALSLGILLGDSPDPQACVFLGKGRIASLPPDLTPADKIAVTFCFQENGLLHVEGRLLRAKRSQAAGEPLRFEVTVDGTMSETERDAARQSLKGINIE